MLKAKAKINLFLEITGKKAQKHQLLSLVAFANEIYDEIEIKPSDEDRLHVSGNYPSDILLNNSIFKMLNILRAHFRISASYDVTLHKVIPAGAGLGGGTSDAAKVAKYFLELHGLKPANEELLELLLQCGADVPVCYTQEAGYFKGVGSIPGGLEILPKCWVLLVNPNIHVSTAEIFEGILLDVIPSEGEVELPPSFASLQELASFLKTRRNDLESAAIRLYPEIGRLLEEIGKTDCVYHAMTGSGSTCFGLYETKEQAEFAAKKWPQYWVALSSLS